MYKRQLFTIAAGVWAIFVAFQSKGTGRIVSLVVLAAAAVGIYFFYQYTPDVVDGIQPQQYQQFNPFYVVAQPPYRWLSSAGSPARRKNRRLRARLAMV